MIEYHVSGYCKGRYFREIFSNKESALDYAHNFKLWATEGDFCHILRCKVEDEILWKDIN